MKPALIRGVVTVGFMTMINENGVVIYTNGTYAIYVMLPGTNGTSPDELHIMVTGLDVEEPLEICTHDVSFEDLTDENFYFDYSKLLEKVYPMMLKYGSSYNLQAA
jgi:hypothetical protein